MYIRIYTYIRFWPTLLVFPLRPSHTGSHGNQKDPLRDQSARNELIRPNISSHIHTRTHTQTNTHTSGAAKPVCARLHSHRNPPLARLMTRVGQNHICTVYVRYQWQGHQQIYGHLRCIYTVLANHIHLVLLHSIPTRFCSPWLVQRVLMTACIACSSKDGQILRRVPSQQKCSQSTQCAGISQWEALDVRCLAAK